MNNVEILHTVISILGIIIGVVVVVVVVDEMILGSYNETTK